MLMCRPVIEILLVTKLDKYHNIIFKCEQRYYFPRIKIILIYFQNWSKKYDLTK